LGLRVTKKTEIIWLIAASFIAAGFFVFLLWLALLGEHYQQTYREFLSFVIWLILGLGFASDISASPPIRPKFAIIVVACWFGSVVAYLLPELGHLSESYFIGPIAVLGFTISLLSIAVYEILGLRRQQSNLAFFSYDELVPLLESFLVRWQAKENLGTDPSRWLRVEPEDRVDLQKSARVLSDQLLQLISKHSNEWDAGIKNQITIASEQLRLFGVVQPTFGQKDLDFASMDSHGRLAFEVARAIVAWVKEKKEQSSG
jgi:hypothetical protein